MNQLQRFYQWIISTPALLELKAPVTDFSDMNIPPLSDSREYSGNPRLGFIYQHLTNEVLINSGRYSIELEEIQLNDNGRTIGAIDMIVADQQKNERQHWEVAIKFYLLHNGVWYGPNAHDQLDKKLDRMLTHQLAMSECQTFIKQYPDHIPDSKRLLLQGRLYINPFRDEVVPTHCLSYKINPSQICGYWCYQHQWTQIEEDLFELEKVDWAAGSPVSGEPITDPSGRFTHAVSQSGRFWFIVNEQWPNN